jgi:hypothetical protein
VAQRGARAVLARVRARAAARFPQQRLRDNHNNTLRDNHNNTLMAHADDKLEELPEELGTVVFHQKGSEGVRCVCARVRRHRARRYVCTRRADVTGACPCRRCAACGDRLDAAPTREELSAGLTYFGNRLCPFAHRAWWAMHEKNVADEAR